MTRTMNENLQGAHVEGPGQREVGRAGVEPGARPGPARVGPRGRRSSTPGLHAAGSPGGT